MTGDLISREALKKQVKELLDLAVKRVDDTPNNSPCYRMYVAQENERARLIDLIDNAPTVEIYSEEDMCDTTSNGFDIGYDFAKAKYERPQGKWFEYIDKGLLKARHGDYVLYKADFLLDNLAREVNTMEGARRMKGGAE